MLNLENIKSVSPHRIEQIESMARDRHMSRIKNNLESRLFVLATCESWSCENRQYHRGFADT